MSSLITYMSSLTLPAWESRFKASNHALTITPIVLTLTQISTNWKISVNITKLTKQNWFAKYGNSKGARTFNCEWCRQSCKIKKTAKKNPAMLLHVIQNLILMVFQISSEGSQPNVLCVFFSREFSCSSGWSWYKATYID